MDADEFVARMVAAGIPDMQFLPEVQSDTAPPSQLPRMPSLPSDTASVQDKCVILSLSLIRHIRLSSLQAIRHL